MLILGRYSPSVCILPGFRFTPRFCRLSFSIEMPNTEADMVATVNRKKPTLEWLNKVMKDRHNAWFSEQIDSHLFHYTSRHQQFYVKLAGSAAVIYSFHETIPLTDADPGM